MPVTPFRRVAIIGTGLMGGSFALALRKHFPDARIIGFDRAPVLAEAQALGAIHEATTDLATAVAAADLIYVALPISSTMELLPEIARLAPPAALVTDACSTKRTICKSAAQHFRGEAMFVGGHPMSGKEVKGAAAAGSELFQGAQYILVGNEKAQEDYRAISFAELLIALGARPVWMNAETHDWAVAIISHLPQMAAVALALVISEETDETGLPASLAGPGVRDSLRLSGSPYAMWRDIAVTNRDNISFALDRLVQAIEQLRAHLTSRELEEFFAEANRLNRTLKDSQQ
jgi:prephenate dehydrogenase